MFGMIFSLVNFVERVLFFIDSMYNRLQLEIKNHKINLVTDSETITMLKLSYALRGSLIVLSERSFI